MLGFFWGHIFFFLDYKLFGVSDHAVTGTAALQLPWNLGPRA